MSLASVYQSLQDMLSTTQYHDVRTERGKVYEIKTRLASVSSPINFLIVTGDINFHALTSIETGLKVTIDIIEGATVASGSEGTLVTIRNLNRYYPDNGLKTKVYYESTYSGGTTILQLQSGFGTNPGLASSGIAGETFKRIFRPNTKYIYLITPSASTDIVISAVMMERMISK